MNSLWIALGAGVLYLLAYYTYGRFLAKKIFQISKNNICPSVAMRDDVDYVPTKKQILFGHHFATIAGTGPIVGPAIAIIWGWLPALLWVVFGSIFMGAVHDFGALVVSLRNQGRSIGDLAGDLISKRVKVLFLLIIFFLLLLVITVFGVVIGSCFRLYPEAVAPVWLQIPIALALGYLVYQKNLNPTLMGIIAVILMYGTIVLGSFFPLAMPSLGVNFGDGVWEMALDPLEIWIILLLIYVYIASTLPVQMLLQPRDFINSYQLLIAMLLLTGGVIFCHPVMVAPAVNTVPDSPPVLPMLFVIVACGALSGFHSLASSGTTSKQCAGEADAQFIGYGSMLVEGMLAVFVIIACGAGIASGVGGSSDAFSQYYPNWSATNGLSAQLKAFIDGSTNMIATMGLPPKVIISLMGVFVVSFAATSLDSATRIQRYIVGELARFCKLPHLAGKHPATMIAVGSAFLLAFWEGSGKAALNLWPLFGSLNQLLGGLALLVVTVYLAKRKTAVIFTALPMVFMIAMTGWAMYYNVIGFAGLKDGVNPNYLLLAISVIIIIFEIWMIFESAVVLYRTYGQPNDKN